MLQILGPDASDTVGENRWMRRRLTPRGLLLPLLLGGQKKLDDADVQEVGFVFLDMRHFSATSWTQTMSNSVAGLCIVTAGIHCFVHERGGVP